MKVFTDYLVLNTPEKRMFLNITPKVEEAVRKSGVHEGLVLVIDEPEANLHPLAQDWLARKIRDLAASGVQVVLTTHSPAFLDVAAIPGLVLVRKNDACTETVQMTAAELAQYCREHGAARATAENILGFYAAAATEEILGGFFARTIVLVEGPSKTALKHEQTGPIVQMTGRTMTDHIVVFEGPRRLAGQTVRIEIDDATSFTLYGDLSELEYDRLLNDDDDNEPANAPPIAPRHSLPLIG